MVKKILFEAGDRSVLPMSPIRLRTGTSPRRTVERVRASVTPGDKDSVVTIKDDIVYAYSIAQGW